MLRAGSGIGCRAAGRTAPRHARSTPVEGGRCAHGGAVRGAKAAADSGARPGDARRRTGAQAARAPCTQAAPRHCLLPRAGSGIGSRATGRGGARVDLIEAVVAAIDAAAEGVALLPAEKEPQRRQRPHLHRVPPRCPRVQHPHVHRRRPHQVRYRAQLHLPPHPPPSARRDPRTCRSRSRSRSRSRTCGAACRTRAHGCQPYTSNSAHLRCGPATA